MFFPLPELGDQSEPHHRKNLVLQNLSTPSALLAIKTKQNLLQYIPPFVHFDEGGYDLVTVNLTFSSLNSAKCENVNQVCHYQFTS